MVTAKRKRILCIALTAVVIMLLSPGAGAQPLSSPQAVPVLFYDTAQPGRPRIIVDSFTVEGGGIIPGTESELRITLRNTSALIEATSILVTGRLAGDALFPVDFDHTNQAYVGRIGPLQTRDVVFSLISRSVNMLALDAVSLNIDIAYSCDQYPDNMNTVLLRLPVCFDQPDPEALPDFVVPEPVQARAWMPPPENMQKIYAGGCVLCALAACVSGLRRRRR